MEALTNQEEVELRSKIEALGLEVTKVPSKSTKNLDEVDLNPFLKLVSDVTSFFHFLLFIHVCDKHHLLCRVSLLCLFILTDSWK